MKRSSLFFLVFITGLPLFGQIVCPSKDATLKATSISGNEEESLARLDQEWRDHQELSLSTQALSESAPILTIPVVFHIITEFGGGLPQARAEQSIAWMNDAFRNIGFYDPSQGVDVEIEFCLAKQDPDGNPSTGVTRVTSDLAKLVLDFQDRVLKDLIRWDTRDYLNVWVVEDIRSPSLGDGVAGYATFPNLHGMETDGIVVEQIFVGVSEERNSIMVHEAGHYLGLYHTFEGGCQNDDCTIDGDQVCDTPPDQSIGYVPCNETMNSCQTDINSGFTTDQDDLTRNYMDYSRIECYNQFTPLQKDRMRFFLETTRRSLLDSRGCEDLCTANISTSIGLPPAPYIVCDSIALTNTSSGAATYQWFIDGIFYRNGGDVRAWFEQPGTYEVVLEAKNGDGNCVAYDTAFITVQCGFVIDLLTNVEPCYPNTGPLTFEIADIPGATISWRIGNQQVGQGSSLTFPFVDGGYNLTVAVDDGKCKAELSFPVLVGCKEICGNGFDDDNDGLYDCFDPDCCDECQDHYFQACSPAYEDCLPTQELSIRKKWDSDLEYIAVFSLVSGDIDGDGEVEIITWKFNTGLVVLDANGNEELVIGQPDGERINWVMPMAIADIEGDGTAELFYFNIRNQLVSAEHDGTLRWVSNTVTSPNGSFQWDPLHVVDSDLDGNAEVVLAYNFYDAATGQLLGRPGADVPLAFPGGQYVLADILDDDACPDCEGLELINGSQVVSISDNFDRFTVTTTNGFRSGGHASVVDWDLDGDLDVVGSFTGRITVWDGQSSSVLEEVLTGRRIGNATASNLDSDPEPEVVMIPQEDDAVLAFDNDLSPTWVAPIVGSSGINPMCFDFEYDGKNEVVIRDEENLLILNGETGNRRIVIPCASITNDERPMITDIDGDGHAELLTSCTIGSIRNGSPSQVSCFEGDVVEWPKTRPIMPSYGNFHTGFNDDLTIPSYSQRHHLPPSIQDFNSSMTQVAIPSEPDTLEFSAILDSFRCSDNGTIQIQLTICNSGTSQENDLDITFYNGSPQDAGTQRITTLTIDVSGLNSKDCITQKFEISNPLGFPSGELCILINDPGTRALPFDFLDGNGFNGPGECDYLNNIICPRLPNVGTSVSVEDQVVCGNDSTTISLDQVYARYEWSTGETTSSIQIIDPGTYWVEVGGGCGGMDRDTFEVRLRESPMLLLPDTIRSCSSQVINLRVPSGFKSYSWQDGRRDSFYTVFNPGIYWVEVVDSCDVTLRDSSIIIFEEEVDLALPDTVDICPGDTVTLSIAGFTEVSWEPNSDIDCIDCPTVKVYPITSSWYYAFVNTEGGCFASDSTWIEVQEEIAIADTVFTCQGDSITYQNEQFGLGDYSITLINPNGCDTIIALSVQDLEGDTLREIVPVCFGDSLFFRGNFYQPGEYILTFDGGADCDTVYNLTVVERPDIQATLITSPTCPGDSSGSATVIAMVSGTRLVANWSGGTSVDDTTVVGLEAGTYAVIVIDELNCSRRFVFEIETAPVVDYDIQVTLDSCNGTDGFGIELTGGVMAQVNGQGLNDAGTSFQNLDQGSYQLSITDTSGCFVTDTTIVLEPLSSFDYDLQESIIIQPGETATAFITGDLDNISMITWQDEVGLLCSDCTFLEANPLSTTTYTVEIIDENGCITLLEIEVIVDGSVNVYVPNIFSPNGDNLNDLLKVFSNVDGLIIDQFEVYSRWGSLVYQENDNTVQNFQGWNGTFNGEMMSPDVFIYTLTYDIGGEKESISGSVTLQL